MDPLLSRSNPNKGPKLLITDSNGRLINTGNRSVNDPYNSHNNIIHSARSTRSTGTHASHAGVSDDTDYIAFDQHEDQLSLEEEEKLQMYDPNAEFMNNSSNEDETTTNDPTFTSGNGVFDDLEFLHDFLEHEAKQSFFESNCFKINCKNLSILCLIIIVIGSGLYVLYCFEQDYINKNYVELLKLASIPLICIAFTYGHIAMALWSMFWPTEFFPFKALQWQSGPLKGYGLGWQGIVPMKAVKMAQIAVDLMVCNDIDINVINDI